MMSIIVNSSFEAQFIDCMKINWHLNLWFDNQSDIYMNLLAIKFTTWFWKYCNIDIITQIFTQNLTIKWITGN
jgi:hypothetical protein